MDYLLHLIVISLIYAILGISLNLLLGHAGMMSMGHAAFFGVGAYASALMVIHWDAHFLVGMLAGVVLAMIISAIVAIPALRVRDEYLVVLTLGVQMAIYGLMTGNVRVFGGTVGLVGIPRIEIFGTRIVSPLAHLPLVLAFGGLCCAIAWRATQSPFGRVLRAMRDDELAVRMLGKDILRYKVWVFVMAGGLAAIAGSLLAHYATAISPASFSVDETIFIVAIVIIGGMANIWGSVIAAFVLVMLPEALTFLPGAGLEISAVRMVLFGAGLVLFMRFRPQGMIPEHVRFRRKAAKGPASEALSTEEMYRVLAEGAAEESLGEAQLNDERVLEIKGLSKRFGGIRAADNVSLALERGKITALIGPNGAGKTTIFNLVTGFLKADEGAVYLSGRDISNLQPHQVSRLGLGRSFQEVRVFGGMTLLDNVLVAGAKQSGENLGALFFQPGKVAREERENRERAMTYLRFVGLGDKGEELARDLSFAEQKLLVLASMLASGAEVLLIDELVSGIDPTSIDSVLTLIRRLASLGKTICIIEHNLDVVKGIADVAYFLANGQVMATGTPSELMADAKLAEIYFGV